MAPLVSLNLRYRRLSSKSEIYSVGLSSSVRSPAAYATFNGGQMDQTWLDMFDLNTQRGYSKIAGGHAVFSPPVKGGQTRVAALRDWTVQLGSGVEYKHSSTVMVRDFTTGKTAVELKAARSEPVVWSADGAAIAAGEASGNRIGVWDARTGALLGRVVAHIDKVSFAAFTPDMKLVTASRDGTLRLSNPTTSKTIAKLEIEGPGASNPRTLAVSPDGSTIVSIWGSTVHIWLPKASHLTSYTLASVRRKEGFPLAISPDCRYIVSWTEDGFDIMDVASGNVVAERDGGALVTAAAFSADASVLLLGRMDGFVEAWDVSTKQ